MTGSPVERDEADGRGFAGETLKAARARADILEVATEEFAAKGLTGARVDEIAERTRTTKRMIYYYFRSKDDLFLASLERAYARIRSVEGGVDVDDLPPLEGLRAIALATFDHHTAHPDFIRLVGVANVHAAQHLRRSSTILAQNDAVTGVLTRVLARGARTGETRPDVDAIDVHLMISSFACFHVANRHTFAAIFGRDLLSPATRASSRRLLGEMVVATVSAAGPHAVSPSTPSTPAR